MILAKFNYIGHVDRFNHFENKANFIKLINFCSSGYALLIPNENIVLTKVMISIHLLKLLVMESARANILHQHSMLLFPN